MTARSRRRSRASASCRNTAARAWRPCLPRWRRCRRPVPIRSASTTTARITAYLLQANAIVAGTSELPSDAAALARMTIPVGGFSVTSYSPYAPALPAVKRPNPLDGFTPISDAQLVEPAAQDWLTWRRSYDAQGFSPLTQITAKQRRRPARRVELDAAARIVRVHAARARRRHVRAGIQRPGAGARRAHRRPAVAVPAPPAPRRRRQLQARAGAARQPSLHGHVRRARHRARREDRHAGVGADRRRPEGARADWRRPARRPGQGDDRDRGHRRRRQARRARDRRPRRRDRPHRVARPHHRAAGHARRRQLERHAAAAAQRRVGVDAGQLRSRHRPRLLRHRQHLRHRPAGEADRDAGRDQRRALHRFDAGDRSRYRQSWCGTSSTIPTISGISTGRSSGS